MMREQYIKLLKKINDKAFIEKYAVEVSDFSYSTSTQINVVRDDTSKPETYFNFSFTYIINENGLTGFANALCGAKILYPVSEDENKVIVQLIAEIKKKIEEYRSDIIDNIVENW